MSVMEEAEVFISQLVVVVANGSCVEYVHVCYVGPGLSWEGWFCHYGYTTKKVTAHQCCSVANVELSLKMNQKLKLAQNVVAAFNVDVVKHEFIS